MTSIHAVEPTPSPATTQILPYHSFLSYTAANMVERFPTYRLALHPSARKGIRPVPIAKRMMPPKTDYRVLQGLTEPDYPLPVEMTTRGIASLSLNMSSAFDAPYDPKSLEDTHSLEIDSGTDWVLDRPLRLLPRGTKGNPYPNEPVIAEEYIFAPAYQTTAWQHYQVEIIDEAGTAVAPRAQELEQAPMLEHGVILFNIIVALEYTPTRAELTDLVSAFRSASDLLQDVTNGLMAIGQVVVGDQEWLPYADVHVLASNRLYPRAGIRDFAHADLPLSPVQLGRGLWHRELHYPIAWREAEGFRVLLHEWLHYALGLPDLYDHTIMVADSEGKRARVTLPLLDPNVPSVMSHLVGVSELQERLYQQLRAAKGTPFGLPPYQAHEGPDRLTLPLPRVYYSLDPASVEPVLTSFPPDTPLTQPERCWLYLLELESGRLVPQGSLDRRAIPVSVEDQERRGWTEDSCVRDLGTADIAYRFALCDAAVGDHLVAVIERAVVPPGAVPTTVWTTQINALDDETGVVTVAPWRDATPAPETRLTVQPQQQKTSAGDDYAYTLTFTVTSATPPTSLSFYPAGAGTPLPLDLGAWQARTLRAWTATLDVGDAVDGHIIATWAHAYCIASVSQGGPGPGNNGTDGGPPHSAGSAAGDLRIYMSAGDGDAAHEPLRHRDGALIKILTTRLASFSLTVPASTPVFAVAPTHPLSRVAQITLVVFCERRLAHQRTAHDQLIHWRPELYNDDNWTIPLPVAYDDPVGRFIAIRLTPETAPALFRNRAGLQCFQMRWVPYRVRAAEAGQQI